MKIAFDKARNKILEITKKEPLIRHDYMSANIKKQELNVFKIPIEFLKLNPYNTRLESEFLKLNIKQKDSRDWYYSSEGQEKLKEIILNKNFSKNEQTRKSLKDSFQKLPGVITNDGVIISGNRRFSAILKNNEKAKSDDEKINFFHAIVEKNVSHNQFDEILELEIKHQNDYDPILDYDKIDVLLAAKKLNSLGKDEENIKNILKLKKSVSIALNVLELMEEYLEFINKKNNYDFVSNSLEKHFETLEMRNRQLLKNNPEIKKKWPAKPEDFSEFKEIMFKFIRFKPNWKKYYDIINFSNDVHLFLYEETWKKFKELLDKFYENCLKMENNLKKESDKNSIEIEKIILFKKKNQFQKEILDLFYKEIEYLGNKNFPNKIIKDLEKNITNLSDIFEESDSDPKISKTSRQSLVNCKERIDIILEKIKK